MNECETTVRRGATLRMQPGEKFIQPRPLRVVCSWCTVKSGGRFESVIQDGLYPTSHGICPCCSVEEKAKYAACRLNFKFSPGTEVRLETLKSQGALIPPVVGGGA